MRWTALLLMLAACSMGALGNGDNPDAQASSDGPTCGIAVVFDPVHPFASPVLPIRVYTNVQNVSGVLTYTWDVRTSSGQVVPFTKEASDGSQINFVAPNPGTYTANVRIDGSPLGCSYGSGFVTVYPPDAATQVYRLRTTPPASLAPPQESYVQIVGGTDPQVRTIALEEGTLASGTVRDPANLGVQAYLKFIPPSMPGAYTELFTQTNGGYSVRLLLLGGQSQHQVLVVPAVGGLAPRLADWTSAMTTIQVGPGTVVSGTVRAPGGGALGGAKVQLYSGIVPSTIATTAGDGTYSLRADFGAGASVTVKVTPPASSGLPRLEATSTFSLGQALNINYASITTCDLGNQTVRRSGVAQAGAKVFVVGTMTTGGTVGGVNASGTVHVAATADGAGRLPTTLVPRAPLSAVTEISAMDHAVSALDTTAGCALTIDAPPQVVASGTTRNFASTTLAGVRVEATSTGALALAGIPAVETTSNANAMFSLPLAAGGHYDVRFSDPLARAAPLILYDKTQAGVPSNPLLPKSLALIGDVHTTTSSNPVIGASIQLLCGTCTGLDAARPISETATDTISNYRLAVPDPGTL